MRGWAIASAVALGIWALGAVMLATQPPAVARIVDERRPYLPPPTATPNGRPAELRCWPVDESPSPVLCCFLWVANVLEDGRWQFLACLR